MTHYLNLIKAHFILNVKTWQFERLDNASGCVHVDCMYILYNRLAWTRKQSGWRFERDRMRITGAPANRLSFYRAFLEQFNYDRRGGGDTGRGTVIDLIKN